MTEPSQSSRNGLACHASESPGLCSICTCHAVCEECALCRFCCKSFYTALSKAASIRPSPPVHHISQALLAKRSPYFAALLSFNGKVAAENTVSLDEEGGVFVDAFDAFVEFLYINKYSVPPYMPRSEAIFLHASISVLADRLMIADLIGPAIKNARIVMALSYSEVDTLIPLSMLYRLVELASTHMPEYYDTNTTAAHRGAMRSLIAQYCASKYSKLKKEPDFMALMKKHVDFWGQVVYFLRDGTLVTRGYS